MTRIVRHRFVVIACLAFEAIRIPALHAQDGSAKAIFEKFNQIGTFAWNCGRPPSEDNLYYVNRVLDGGRVQRDQMSGPSTRDSVAIIDEATASGPNEITLSGTRDGEPIDAIWRVEGGRQLAVEVTIAGKKVISGGRFVRTGKELPWTNKCG